MTTFSSVIYGEPPSRKDFWKLSRTGEGDILLSQQDPNSKWHRDAVEILRAEYNRKGKLKGLLTLEATFVVRRLKTMQELLEALTDVLKKVCIESEYQIIETDLKLVKETEVVDGNLKPCMTEFVIKEYNASKET